MTQNDISSGKTMIFLIKLEKSVFSIRLEIILPVQFKKKKITVLPLEISFWVIFSTFQKWHLEDHRTVFKENRGKKLLSMVILAKNMSFSLKKKLFIKHFGSKHGF